MDQEYDKLNVRLLSILAYVGPLFMMGKVAVEKEHPEVKFHARQGSILFVFTVLAYGIATLLCFLLSGLPAAEEIVGLLLYVGITVAWLILAVMGIIGAIRHQQRPLPFIGDVDRLFRK